jgi:hypothetical protein
VKEAWLEKRWLYGKNEDETIFPSPENFSYVLILLSRIKKGRFKMDHWSEW